MSGFYLAYGPAITLAETRAARDALERYYLEEENYNENNPLSEMLPSSLLEASQQKSWSSIQIHDTPAYPPSAKKHE